MNRKLPALDHFWPALLATARAAPTAKEACQKSLAACRWPDGFSREQLQVYLDEFVFRHNRRNLPMAAFQTLLGLGTGQEPTQYEQIRGAADLAGSSNNTLGQAETTG